MTIKEIGEKYKISQSALARRFNIPLRTVQGWHIGERKPPDYVIAMMEEIFSLEQMIDIAEMSLTARAEGKTYAQAVSDENK